MNGANILEIHETGRFQISTPRTTAAKDCSSICRRWHRRFSAMNPGLLRAVSATFGVATVWTTYLLATELFSPWIGLLAAFFTAASYWHLMLSRLGTRAVSASFFLTLTCTCCWWAFDG